MSQMNPTAGNIVFDTLGAFQRLKASGMPEAQAQTQVEIILEIFEDKLATKRDLKELEVKMDARFTEMKAEMDARFTEVKAEMDARSTEAKSERQTLEYRITANIIKWVAGLLIAQAAAIAALVKLL
jgi:hypothetical protein